jgi:hypothetical protein
MQKGSRKESPPPASLTAKNAESSKGRSPPGGYPWAVVLRARSGYKAPTKRGTGRLQSADFRERSLGNAC